MHRRVRRLSAAAAAVAGASLAVAACGSGDTSDTTTRAAAAPATRAADLGAIKAFLLDHTRRLTADTAGIRATAEQYDRLAARYDHDHAAMLRGDREQVASLVRRLQRGFTDANPSYEEMEGVVAGVPSLADYDVAIDAGADKSDPENAVSFSVKTEDGRVYEQPGNFNYLIETAAYGTEPRFAAKNVKPDLDGDGKVEFGEALPDAQFVSAAARQFEQTAGDLDADARAWTPTAQDALTALVVMTPTMSEYFSAWKNSRAIAGDEATEKAFVAASRLQDITDILGGLALVYANVEPAIAEVDPAQARQTGADLKKLRDFAARLRDEEASGKAFTAEDADVLGTQAQKQAEAIAGQIAQAARKLDIELES